MAGGRCRTPVFLCLLVAAAAVSVQGQEKVEFVAQTGHSSQVFQVAFSSDGESLASVGGDGAVKMWSVASGRLLRTVERSPGVTAVAFSPDGKLLVVGSSGGDLRVREASSGSLLRTLKGRSNWVTDVAFSPDGKTLASTGWDRTVRLWRMPSGEPLRSFKAHMDDVTALAFSPSGATLASASEDKSVKVWEVASGKLLRTLKGHSDWVSDVAFGPDGKIIATAGWDDTVRIWDAASGRSLAIHESESWPSRSASAFSLAFSPDGRTLALGLGAGGSVSLREPGTWKLVSVLEGHSSLVYCVAFSPDGRHLASADADGRILIWDTASGRRLKSMDENSVVRKAAFSPDGKTLVSGTKDGLVGIWDTASGRLVVSLPAHAEPVHLLAFAPDGKTFASSTFTAFDTTLKLWDAVSGRPLLSLVPKCDLLYFVTFSPDGRKLATACSVVQIWDVAAGTLLHTLRHPTARHFYEARFSPDGKRLVATAGDAVMTWSAESGTLLGETHVEPAESVTTLSPDGAIIATVKNGRTQQVKLWDVASGRLLRILSFPSWSGSSLDFSPDGTLLVSAGLDYFAWIWEVASGKLLSRFQTKPDSLVEVSVSADGKRIATSARDGGLSISDLATGTVLTTSYSWQGGEYLTFTPEGYYLASEGAEARAAWKIGEAIYSFEQYSETFRRPDLVARRLAGLPVDLPDVRLLVDRPPEIAWLAPFAVSGEPKRVISLSYQGTSNLDHLVVVFNNRPIEIDRPSASRKATIQIPVTLTARHNHLVAIAFDEKRLKSRPLTLQFEYSGAPAAEAAAVTFFHATGEHTLTEGFLLRFQVESPGEPAAVRLIQNEQPLTLGAPTKTQEGSGRVVALYEVPVALRIDANHFEVMAVSQDGIASHGRLSIVRDPVSRLWVVAAGISDYADPEIADLGFAVADARAIHDYYREAFHLLADHLFLLTDQEASLRSLKGLIGTRLAREVEPHDTVLLYFAGHGLAEPDPRGPGTDRFVRYLLPHDAQRSDPFGTALAVDELIERILPRLRAERVVLVLDSCFSGRAGGRTLPGPFRLTPSEDDFLDRMARAGRGQVILAASDTKEVAREDSQLGHGVFTYYFLEGLRGEAETGKDPGIDIQELYDYVWQAVREATGKAQTPVLEAPLMKGRIVIGRALDQAPPP